MFFGVITAIITGITIPANIYLFGNLVGDMVKAQLGIIAHNMTQLKYLTDVPENLEENIEIGMNVSKEFIMDAVTKFAIGNCTIAAILMIFSYIGIMLFNYTALKQSFRVRTLYLRSVLHQDIAWYDVSKSGEVASRLTE